MELAVWNEVAWIKMGDADLTAWCAHRLQIRLLPRPADPKNPDKGLAGMLYCSDALCLYHGAFHPNGACKPDVDWRIDDDKKAAATCLACRQEPTRRNEAK